MKVFDTVVLVSYTDKSNTLHARAEAHVTSLTSRSDGFVPSVVLHEYDTVLKNRSVSFEDREKLFDLLSSVIPRRKILRSTTTQLKRAAGLDKTASWQSHYFDVMIASCALENSATLITTDTEIPKLGVKVEW